MEFVGKPGRNRMSSRIFCVIFRLHGDCGEPSRWTFNSHSLAPTKRIECRVHNTQPSSADGADNTRHRWIINSIKHRLRDWYSFWFHFDYDGMGIGNRRCLFIISNIPVWCWKIWRMKEKNSFPFFFHCFRWIKRDAGGFHSPGIPNSISNGARITEDGPLIHLVFFGCIGFSFYLHNL